MKRFLISIIVIAAVTLIGYVFSNADGIYFLEGFVYAVEFSALVYNLRRQLKKL